MDVILIVVLILAVGTAILKVMSKEEKPSHPSPAPPKPDVSYHVFLNAAETVFRTKDSEKIASFLDVNHDKIQEYLREYDFMLRWDALREQYNV